MARPAPRPELGEDAASEPPPRDAVEAVLHAATDNVGSSSSSPAPAAPISSPPLALVVTYEPVPVEREGLEAAVKAAEAPQQLEHLLVQYPPAQLSPPELVLFCNQLAKVTNAASTTVRGWGQTQVGDCQHYRYRGACFFFPMRPHAN